MSKLMCEKVAERLNYLRLQSLRCHHLSRAKINDVEDCIVWVGNRHVGETVPDDNVAVRDACTAAVLSHFPQAVHDEIRAAAKESRRADVDELKDGYSYTVSKATSLACLRAQPQIAEILRISEETRKKAYEDYRIYCEQGVAVI